MKPPPPIPHEYGSTTPSTPAAATAASIALPPRRSTSIAARVASGSTVAAGPPVPTAVGRLAGAWLFCAGAVAGTANSAATSRSVTSGRRMARSYPQCAPADAARALVLGLGCAPIAPGRDAACAGAGAPNVAGMRAATLRWKLVLALVLTSAAPLVAATAALLPPLEHRIAAERLDDLSHIAGTAALDLRRLPPRDPRPRSARLAPPLYRPPAR